MRLYPLLLALFAQNVAANCNEFNNLVNYWNVITEGDVQLIRSDFEGRSWIGGTLNAQNWALGEKLHFQCTNDPVAYIGRVVANSGNACGGKIASNAAQFSASGSNVNCGHYGSKRDCGGPGPVPNSFVSRIVWARRVTQFLAKPDGPSSKSRQLGVWTTANRSMFSIRRKIELPKQ